MVIDERLLYITKLHHHSTRNSKGSTRRPTTKSALPTEPPPTLTQFRIWPPFLDNTVVRTISVHQVYPPQQTSQTPDRQDINMSKRCNINKRIRLMPNRSITLLIRAMLLLSLDRSFMVKGEVLGPATWLNIIMVLFLRHEANGRRLCLVILLTGRSTNQRCDQVSSGL